MRWRLSSRSALACSRKPCERMRARATLVCSSVRPRRDRELSVLRSTARAQRERVRDAQKLAQAKRAVEEMLERVRRAQLANLALSRRKQGFESPRERQKYININIMLP